MPEENIKSVVVDASFILAYLLPDEQFPADEILKQFKSGKLKFISVKLLPFEVLNSLKSALKSKRINHRQAKILINRFFKLGINLIKVDFAAVFGLAVKHSLTVYDAGYLWLAKNKKVKLQTLDKQLKKIAG